jgi:hypothetical protein
METRSNFARSVGKFLVGALVLPFQISVWAAQEDPVDPDRATISRMEPSELALSILSVRTDLNQYSKDDLTTTSGQYELLYDEVMGPCKRRKDHTQPYRVCTGSSVNVSFAAYLMSNQRVCPDPETGSCWKPALTEIEMRDELFELVRKMRNLRYLSGNERVSTE